MKYTGERLVPIEDAQNVHPTFQHKMEAEHLARYNFAAQFVKGKVVLDLGCGTGYGSDFLLKTAGPAQIHAFDISEDAMAYAQKKFQRPGLEFRVANAEEIPYGDQMFDVIVCFELIEHVNDYKKVFQHIRRVLKPNGILIMSTPRRKEQRRNEFHTFEFSEADFRSTLKESFGEKVKLYIQNNNFASLISDGNDITRINRVLSLDEFTIPETDYFVAVCGGVDFAQLPQAELVIENDSYVLNLEHDVEVLRTAEKEMQKRIVKTDEIVTSHSQWVKNLQAEKEELEKKITRLTESFDNFESLLKEKDGIIMQYHLSRQETEELLKTKDERINNLHLSIKEKDEMIITLHQQTQQIHDALNKKEELLHVRQKELDFVTSSKFWKLRNQYMAIKSKFARS